MKRSAVYLIEGRYKNATKNQGWWPTGLGWSRRADDQQLLQQMKHFQQANPECDYRITQFEALHGLYAAEEMDQANKQPESKTKKFKGILESCLATETCSVVSAGLMTLFGS